MNKDQNTFECPKCNGSMEIGIPLDRGHSNCFLHQHWCCAVYCLSRVQVLNEVGRLGVGLHVQAEFGTFRQKRLVKAKSGVSEGR